MNPGHLCHESQVFTTRLLRLGWFGCAKNYEFITCYFLTHYIYIGKKTHFSVQILWFSGLHIVLLANKISLVRALLLPKLFDCMQLDELQVDENLYISSIFISITCSYWNNRIWCWGMDGVIHIHCRKYLCWFSLFWLLIKSDGTGWKSSHHIDVREVHRPKWLY